MQEEDALPQSPQGCRAEFPRAGLPCEMPSARPTPMSCSSSRKEIDLLTPESRDAGAAVSSAGVWHSAQPTFTNRLLPLAMEVAPPGVSGEGVAQRGSAGKGEPLDRADRLQRLRGIDSGYVIGDLRELARRSLIALGLEQLVGDPISTLYASPENSRSDLFCAFHPKRATVPSLPLWFVRPEMPSTPFRIA